MRHEAMFLVLSATAALSMSTGCPGAQVKDDKMDKIQEEHKTEKMDGGYPKWITQCAPGLPKKTLCASGSSDLAATDVEAAKTDAEITAKNALADQLKTKVGRLQERSVDVMKDLARGKAVGERTLKDINQNYINQEMVGLRYVEYFYYPNPIEPTKIFVLATLDVDDASLSQSIVDGMMQAAISEHLEMKHEEAMARFDAVRKQYLMEEDEKADKDHKEE